MVEIMKDQKYSIIYDIDSASLMFSGSFVLNSSLDYDPILQLLKQTADKHEPHKLVLDISGLKFMNSSGLNMITKFIMYFNDVKKYKLKLYIKIHRKINWQEKLCCNMGKLLESLEVLYDD